jgi:hypothetical protein
MSCKLKMWLADGNARLTDVKAMECADRMGTRTDGGELRVHDFRADLDQLNQYLDSEGTSSLPWSYCSAVDMC